MTVHVELGERSYNILLRPGALKTPGDLPLPAAALPGEVALVTNTSVGPLYGDALEVSLAGLGQKVARFDAPDGESAKTMENVGRAFDALAAARISRSGALWALGGGVTGDMAGFVAATWMRGINFVQIPTTLLAMVDSSVGGKTGVNHPSAKNLIGAFWQPLAVVIDPECLRTLPIRELRAGLAEVIKYGVIADAEFFSWLEENLDAALALDMDVLQHIIARSCEIKAEVVGQDERESDSIGRRQILNYGHTAGHAFEAVASYGTLLHGEAIAIGMTAAAQLAINLGTIEKAEGQDLLQRQTRLFQRANLPTSVPTGMEWERLWHAMTLDKKTRGNSVNFVLPTKLGHVERVSGVNPDAVREALPFE